MPRCMCDRGIIGSVWRRVRFFRSASVAVWRRPVKTGERRTPSLPLGIGGGRGGHGGVGGGRLMNRQRGKGVTLLPCFLPVCNHGIALGQPEETSDEHLAARPGGSKVTPLVTSAFCLEHTSPSFPVCAAKYCGGPFSPWSAGEDSSGLNDPPAHKVGVFKGSVSHSAACNYGEKRVLTLLSPPSSTVH